VCDFLDLPNLFRSDAQAASHSPLVKLRRR
jgi:hypothetical protein